MPTQMLTVKNTSLALKTCGSGQPVVLLHAFPLDHDMWQRVLPLANQVRLIIPDLPGFGRSAGSATDPSLPQSIAQIADDVAALLEALHVNEPAVIVGVSMGGYVAQHLVNRHPDRVSRLVLVDTKFTADTSKARAGRAELAAKVGRLGQRVFAEAMVPNLLAASAAAKSQPDRAYNERLLKEIISRQPVATIQAVLQALGERPDMTEAMRQCNVPVLLLCGAEDTLTPPTEMEAMAAILPVAEFVVVPQAGHLVPLEAPEIFSSALLSFLGLAVKADH